MSNLDWNKNIPDTHQLEMGNAVRRQMLDLPVNLFIEWNSPWYQIEKRWFVEASKYISIPHSEYFLEPVEPSQT